MSFGKLLDPVIDDDVTKAGQNSSPVTVMVSYLSSDSRRALLELFELNKGAYHRDLSPLLYEVYSNYIDSSFPVEVATLQYADGVVIYVRSCNLTEKASCLRTDNISVGVGDNIGGIKIPCNLMARPVHDADMTTLSTLSWRPPTWREVENRSVCGTKREEFKIPCGYYWMFPKFSFPPVLMSSPLELGNTHETARLSVTDNDLVGLFTSTPASIGADNIIGADTDTDNIARSGAVVLEEVGEGERVGYRRFSLSARPNQVKDKHGISALLAAIWEGHTSCVKLLLEHRHQIALTDDPERYQLTARLTDLDKLRGRDSSQEHAELLLFSEFRIATSCSPGEGLDPLDPPCVCAPEPNRLAKFRLEFLTLT
uniref:Uncharacterized protein n=1 Tax=Timema bartmani TaxID=61472 RepID=A0A7R9I5G2_9NEOP|nr:unnamed protein product [Timema bartmani]